MKYRIITDADHGYTVQFRKYFIWWSATKSYLGLNGPSSFKTVDEAEEFMKDHIERRVKIKASGEVVKNIKVSSEDRVLWRLQKK